jgi:hypothetical protein
MTDPTAPVTPRTEAGRPCPHGFTSDCENCWFLRTHEHRFDLFAPDDAVCHADECTVTRGRAIEREAGSTNALRAALIGLDDAFQWIRKEYPAALVAMPTEFYRGFEQARAALAASDAGPAGIDVERLREAFIETGHAIQRVAGNIDERPSFPEVADVYARLSRESDR